MPPGTQSERIDSDYSQQSNNDNTTKSNTDQDYNHSNYDFDYTNFKLSEQNMEIQHNSSNKSSKKRTESFSK